MVFILSALWWIRIRGLWELPDGRDWLKGKLVLVLMGRAMLRKSLIQFSVDGRGCVLSLLFALRPNYGGGNEDNGDLLQKVLSRHCHTQCPWPFTRLPPTHASAGDFLDTHGQFQVSLLWGHCSFLLDPGVHKVLFVPSKSLFLQSCVSSGISMVQLMLTSSKRTYAIPRSAAPRTLPLWQATAALYLCRRHKHSSGSVSVGTLGPGVHKILSMPSKSLFPQSCVSSGGSMVELIATSCKRAFAIPRSAAPRAPAPAAGHC